MPVRCATASSIIASAEAKPWKSVGRSDLPRMNSTRPSTGSAPATSAKRSGISAAEFLRTAPADEIARVFREWGEEPAAEPLAQAIVGSRKFNPVESAADLVSVVERVLRVRDNNQGSHPATRVFQALRIHVNRELDQLTRFLDTVLPQVLRPGGRAVVITFHSIEDRIVKQAFRDSAVWENLTKKPIIATPTEIRLNPRSRTAKLRCVVRK